MIVHRDGDIVLWPGAGLAAVWLYNCVTVYLCDCIIVWPDDWCWHHDCASRWWHCTLAGAGLAAASAPTVRPLEEAWAGPGPAQCAEHRVTCYTHHTLHVTHNNTHNTLHTTLQWAMYTQPIVVASVHYTANTLQYMIIHSVLELEVGNPLNMHIIYINIGE